MAIGLWSAGATLRQDPLFDLCEWYLLLCSFYPPPMRGETMSRSSLTRVSSRR